MEAVSLRKFTSGRRDGRFALVECGRLEAEEMIRTLDANYLSTFHLPRPASGPAPHSCRGYYGFCCGLVAD